ncbi:bifunctional 3'-5' exonuclease/DNA polymerase [Lysinimonas soli]|uniref:DNA-directed DNA polymerase n=1 Tax=Lysinimonas soli TaxID=1074233 RepID=A0ABW0NMK7_9MICO
MHIALRQSAAARVEAVELDDAGAELGRHDLDEGALTQWVREREAGHPRWVWSDTARWYPPLLRAGVRVERCVDLRLCHRILRHAVSAAGSELATGGRDGWDSPPPAPSAAPDALFDLEPPPVDDDPVVEWLRQRSAVEGSSQPGRLALLLAGESVGALVAVEMRFAGLPWSPARHDELLTELLGPRPALGRPALMEAALARVREALDEPDLNPDSPVELVKGLQRAGLRATSTRSWELKRIEHPAIAPLLEYKKLARLYSANGWHWLEEWVHDGRFRPVYVPGGVVTGRWASDGGGALQLPRQLRAAVVADEGWTFVVADASQLEPRVLAAMSGDAAMARAGQAQDMYQGMVDAGAVETRPQAKYGMLGAIYGGTTGESGRMRPRIARAFPTAMAYVESAARAGEKGEVVSTWLGRSSPPGAADSYDETASDAELRKLRNDARGWGRFTRNFVVQGTAAEWALCWMGSLRRRLWQLGGGDAADAPLTDRPHLVFFLHDELIVHTPRALAEQVAAELRESAAEAGRLLFGAAPVEFAVTVAIVDSYDQAK